MDMKLDGWTISGKREIRRRAYLGPGDELRLEQEGQAKHLCQWFSQCGSRETASASPGNLLELQILGPYARPTESETVGLEPNNLFFFNKRISYFYMLARNNRK